MALYQVGIYEKAFPEDLEISEILQSGKNAGYDFLEISIDRTEKRISRLYDSDFQDKLYYSILNTGFPVASMCLSALSTYTLGSENPENVDKANDILRRAVDFSTKFGIRIIQIPACDVPKDGNHTKKTDRRFIENLLKMIDYASSKAVMIGLENMEDSYMDSVEKCMRIINTIQSPYFQLYPDAGNITSSAKLNSIDPEMDLLLGKNHYIALHLKETKPNRYGGLSYGEGHVDFPKFVSDAWKIGIRRFVLEYWFTGNPDWKKDLINNRMKCDKWIYSATNGKKYNGTV